MFPTMVCIFIYIYIISDYSLEYFYFPPVVSGGKRVMVSKIGLLNNQFEDGKKSCWMASGHIWLK